MLYNYFLIHLRSLLRKPILTSINLAGLTIGIAACLLAFLHIQYELSYDEHIENSERKFRVVNGDVDNQNGWVKVSAPIPPYIKDNIPEVSQFTRLAKVMYNPKITVKAGENVFNEENFYMADPAIVSFFSLELLNGEPENVLEDPSNVIISDKISEKLFGQENPVGRIIELGGEHLFEVSGLFKDENKRSHVSLDYIVNFSNLEKLIPGTSLTSNWGQYNYFAYVELTKSGRVFEKVVESKISAITIDLGESKQELADINLQPVSDIHFTSNRGNAKPSYDKKYLFVYAAVAISIFIISIINFINLTIASSTKRIKEVGVRKVVGAKRSQLVLQYISESFFTALLSLLAAIALSNYLLLPFTNQIIDSSIQINLSDPVLVGSFIILLTIIAVLSGSYIALFVTGFQPSKALKGNIKIGNKGGRLKNILLATQFTISLIMILCSFFIYKQMEHLQTKDIGLNAEQVINISLYNKAAKENSERLIQRFSRLSFVEHSTATRFTAGKANWHQTTWWEGQEADESMSVIIADESFIQTLDIEILEGDEAILSSPPNDGEIRYILNKSARDHMGWESAIGRNMHVFGEKSTYPVAGVVADFNYQSLHNEIAPVVIVANKRIQPGQLMVRIKTSDYTMALNELEKEFESVVPNTPFEYNFLDDQFASLYKAENRTKQIIGLITGLALVLALLGLYGLVSFAIQERTKEMAIRKVLGVKIQSVLLLLSNSYIRLLLASNIIAIPVVWYVMNQWLDNFNYRIDLTITNFIVGSLVVWLFVFFTLIINVYQVSKIDPANGLRYE